jgi:hypothetical protein
MAETTVLKLAFTTDAEKNNAITVKLPASDLTDLSVRNAMDEMIASGAVSAKNGLLSERKYAKLVTNTVTDITLPD